VQWREFCFPEAHPVFAKSGLRRIEAAQGRGSRESAAVALRECWPEEN